MKEFWNILSYLELCYDAISVKVNMKVGHSQN